MLTPSSLSPKKLATTIFCAVLISSIYVNTAQAKPTIKRMDFLRTAMTALDVAMSPACKVPRAIRIAEKDTIIWCTAQSKKIFGSTVNSKQMYGTATKRDALEIIAAIKEPVSVLGNEWTYPSDEKSVKKEFVYVKKLKVHVRDTKSLHQSLSAEDAEALFSKIKTRMDEPSKKTQDAGKFQPLPFDVASYIAANFVYANKPQYAWLQNRTLVLSRFPDLLSSDQTLQTNAINALLESLGDTQNEYYPPQADNKEGNIGLGLAIAKDPKGAIIISVNDGTSADRAGLLRGDIITRIDSKEISKTPLYEIRNLLSGKEDTSVRIQLLRKEKNLQLDITRIQYTIPTVSVFQNGEITIMRIAQFGDQGQQRFVELLRNFDKGNGMKALLIDLQNNSGGELESIKTMLGAFMGAGKEMGSVQWKGGVEYFFTKGDKATLYVPIYILVDGDTAAGAEIFTSALREQDNVYAIGQKTMGQGLIHEIIGMRDNSALKLAAGEWLFPDETKLHNKGLVPNIPLTGETRDQRLQEALQYISEKLKVTQ